MEKPKSLLGKLLSFIRSENPETILDKEQDYAVMMLRMSLVGLFETIESVARAGKTAVGSMSVIPAPLIRVYLNGIINSCALVEEAMARSETGPVAETTEPSTKPKTELSDEEFDAVVKGFSKGKP